MPHWSRKTDNEQEKKVPHLSSRPTASDIAFRSSCWTACKLPVSQQSPVCQLHCQCRRVSDVAAGSSSRLKLSQLQRCLWSSEPVVPAPDGRC
ncbi:Wd Repeat-Containing Protein 19 [Manis pentadactyla]|nr:Wd Repeat-Containing Protein 19 [Manis pentadactyla]